VILLGNSRGWRRLVCAIVRRHQWRTVWRSPSDTFDAVTCTRCRTPGWRTR
jgi:hypothetical protein